MIYSLSIIVFAMFVIIAIFQVLLSLGYPLGEYVMGGYYKVLPKKLRIISAFNAVLLLCMSFIFLQHGSVIHSLDFLPINVLAWIITIFLGINTFS